MHREPLSFVCVTSTEFVVSASLDGHVKFWKKSERGLEFVKNFRAHVDAVLGLSSSADGNHVASISTDKTIKIFDVINFGLLFLNDFPS